MADEIRCRYPSGDNLYVRIRNGSGQVWNTSGTPAYEDWNNSNIDDYCIDLTDKGGDLYVGSIPSSLLGTFYIVIPYIKWNGSTATLYDKYIEDTLIEENSLYAHGVREFTYTLLDSGSDPIANAKIWITTDNKYDGNIIASGVTDQNGQYVSYLNAGTVYVWRHKTGYNFDNPDVEVVV